MKDGLEELTNMYVLLKLHNLQNDDDFLIIEKKLKAFNVFIQKDVQITLLKNTQSYEQYNNGLLVYMTKTTAKKMFLTKEQFDFLKEAIQ